MTSSDFPQIVHFNDPNCQQFLSYDVTALSSNFFTFFETILLVLIAANETSTIQAFVKLA